MATGTVRPIADILNGAASGDYNAIDDPVSDPSAGDGTPITWATAQSGNAYRAKMGVINILGTASQIVLKVNCKSTVANFCYMNIFLAGVQTAAQTLTVTTSFAWYTLTLNGTFSKTQLSSLQCQFTADNLSGKSDSAALDVMYASITYVEAPGQNFFMMG